jgi:hypothetical protein
MPISAPSATGRHESSPTTRLCAWAEAVGLDRLDGKAVAFLGCAPLAIAADALAPNQQTRPSTAAPALTPATAL